MESNILKVVSNKCFKAINDCIILRNKEGIICNVSVVITLEELERERVTVKLMDQITGVMKSYGVKHARYQQGTMRFFGVVNLESAVITPGNIPLTKLDEPLVYSLATVTTF